MAGSIMACRQHVRGSSPEHWLFSSSSIVAIEHVPGHLGVAGHEGVQRVVQHGLREIRHARNVNERLDGRMRHIALRGFGDVDGQIADALEIAVDLDRDNGASRRPSAGAAPAA